MSQAKQRRIKAEVNKWCKTCDMEPYDIQYEDAKQIAEYAKATKREVWDYLNYWYRD